MIRHKQVTTKTASATLTLAEMGDIIIDSASNVTITLPVPVGHDGLWYYVFNTGAGVCTINSDGVALNEIKSEESVYLLSDGTSWRVGKSGSDDSSSSDMEMAIYVGYEKPATGTVSATGSIVTGIGTNFTVEIAVQECIRITDGTNSEIRRVINRTDTILILDKNLDYVYASGSSVVIYKLGNDTNSGDEATASGALATINGAMRKIPEFFNGYAEIYLVPGTYISSDFSYNFGDGWVDIVPAPTGDPSNNWLNWDYPEYIIINQLYGSSLIGIALDVMFVTIRSAVLYNCTRLFFDDCIFQPSDTQPQTSAITIHGNGMTYFSYCVFKNSDNGLINYTQRLISINDGAKVDVNRCEGTPTTPYAFQVNGGSILSYDINTQNDLQCVFGFYDDTLPINGLYLPLEANQIAIKDAGSNFISTNVEGALGELAEKIDVSTEDLYLYIGYEKNLSGTVQGYSNNTEVHGTNTLFIDEVAAKDRIRISDGVNTEVRAVVSITNDILLIIDAPFENDYAAGSLLTVYKLGNNANDGSAADEAHALASLQGAFDKIPATLNHYVEIVLVPAEYPSGSQSLSGIHGEGYVDISSHWGFTEYTHVRSSVYFDGCKISGMTIRDIKVMSIDVTRCDAIDLRDIVFDGVGSSGYTVGADYRESVGWISNSHFVNYEHAAIQSQYGSNITLSNNTGSGGLYGLQALNGGQMYIENYPQPTGTVSDRDVASGGIILPTLAADILIVDTDELFEATNVETALKENAMDVAFALLASQRYTHEQTVSSSSWTINHNLGKNVSVTVIDTANTQVFGLVTYISDNQLVLDFSAPFSGKAYII